MKTTMDQMELAQKKNEETERQRRLDDEEKQKEVDAKLKEATQVQSEDALQTQISTLKNQNQMIENQLKIKNQEFQSHLQIEHELRNKNERLITSSRQIELMNRQKDEEILLLKQHVEKAETHVKSFSWLEKQLKKEVTNLQKKRTELEDRLQMAQQQMNAQLMLQRQKEM